MNTDDLRHTLASAPPPPDLWPAVHRRMLRRSRARFAGSVAGVGALVGSAVGIPLILGNGSPHSALPAGTTCAIPVTLATPPSGSPTGQAYARDPAAVAVATRQLVAYLHTWCTDGGTAAFAYLDPEWRGDPPEVVGDPRLTSGAVEIYAMTPTADGYTGYVDLTLHFSGDAAAWNDG